MSLQRCILLISEEIKTVQGFEATTLAGFSKRLFALAAKLYTRMLVRSGIHCVVDLTELHSLLYSGDFTLWVSAPTSGLSGLREEPVRFDLDYPRDASVPASSAGFRHHLSLSDAKFPNKQTPEVQETEPSLWSRYSLHGFHSDAAGHRAPDRRTEDQVTHI